MRIGLFTDSHYSDMEQSCKTRRPSLSYQKIQEVMEAFADAGVSLVICLGDLVDRCKRREDEPLALRRIGDLIRSYQIPFYCLRGNHDCDNFTESDFLRYGGFSAAPFSLHVEGKLLLFLDCNYGEHSGKYLPRQVDWTDSVLPAEQMEQLKHALKCEEASEIYLFLHQRIDECENRRYLVKNAPEIRCLIEECGRVRRVFQGHDHKGDRQIIGGVEYVTLPAMCEGEQNAYRIIEI